jgi:hypothetical protein
MRGGGYGTGSLGSGKGLACLSAELKGNDRRI